MGLAGGYCNRFGFYCRSRRGNKRTGHLSPPTVAHLIVRPARRIAMNRNLNILLAVILVALSPDFVSAEPAERFVGRLRCSNPTADLRSGSFNLGVGDVRLQGGKGCVKPFP